MKFKGAKYPVLIAPTHIPELCAFEVCGARGGREGRMCIFLGGVHRPAEARARCCCSLLHTRAPPHLTLACAQVTDTGIVVGSAITISKLMEGCTKLAASLPPQQAPTFKCARSTRGVGGVRRGSLRAAGGKEGRSDPSPARPRLAPIQTTPLPPPSLPPTPLPPSLPGLWWSRPAGLRAPLSATPPRWEATSAPPRPSPTSIRCGWQRALSLCCWARARVRGVGGGGGVRVGGWVRGSGAEVHCLLGCAGASVRRGWGRSCLPLERTHTHTHSPHARTHAHTRTLTPRTQASAASRLQSSSWATARLTCSLTRSCTRWVGD